MIHAPLRLVLDGDALVSNWHWLAHKSAGAACGAAVKADAYGLGAAEVVKRLAAVGCRDFFVATWAEAAALMPWPDGLALSVLHGVGPEDMAAALALPAKPVLNSPEQTARWRAGGGGRGCDVMVDTGMNRLGLTVRQARSGALDGLKVETLMSHLACADEPDHPMNEHQLGIFRTVRREIAAERYSLANSAGICLGSRYAFGLTRPGLALYGGIPVPGGETAGLRQVVRVQAEVMQVREIAAGASVGYGATFTAPGAMRAAILNIGYADGYLRGFSNSGRARIGEGFAAVIGRVSMDLTAIGLEEGAEVREGDWIDLDYDLPRAAAQSGLSQYELLTGLGTRLRRTWR